MKQQLRIHRIQEKAAKRIASTTGWFIPEHQPDRIAFRRARYFRTREDFSRFLKWLISETKLDGESTICLSLDMNNAFTLYSGDDTVLDATIAQITESNPQLLQKVQITDQRNALSISMKRPMDIRARRHGNEAHTTIQGMLPLSDLAVRTADQLSNTTYPYRWWPRFYRSPYSFPVIRQTTRDTDRSLAWERRRLWVTIATSGVSSAIVSFLIKLWW